ncbi:DUF4870 domain-containing protein [Staphylococcus simiae]|uniref:DUF4870 domain-containing protein n=1 Tax=Staphylococcus simiae TaxID=308354 RepID=UPI001A9766E8|nr:DUF4870 domain-containing protein [Staphylococcus simiae]MBO1199834.1 DUF4870 domain-containing protein [Staphylococcus simiae]MBO1201949.1 DUF4870 domain-containing protein [Staphylococcus simiae]MBO1204172.1 DUF4870 domain-containing protein [Staphylococcus simiae]MBO1211893.1 DUF4870 domain-containing protein [Staphylococcus simiae]MBO1230398.1 DUF4870 domain-containing protein [Staphylococcus simiae]
MSTDIENNMHQYAEPQNKDDNTMAMLIYLLSLFSGIIGPLIIWLIKKSDSKLVDRAGKNYFNFAISYFLWTIALGIICLIGFFFLLTEATALVVIGFIIIFIAVLALFALSILQLVFTIIACVKYMNGQEYLIPLSLRMF